MRFLSAFLLSQNRGKEAEEIFRQIRTLGENDSTNRGALARFYIMVGNVQGAENEYRTILKQHSDDIENSVQLAAVYLEDDKIAEAEQLVNGVVKKSPNNPKTLLFRGRLRAEK